MNNNRESKRARTKEPTWGRKITVNDLDYRYKAGIRGVKIRNQEGVGVFVSYETLTGNVKISDVIDSGDFKCTPKLISAYIRSVER